MINESTRQAVEVALSNAIAGMQTLTANEAEALVKLDEAEARLAAIHRLKVDVQTTIDELSESLGED